MRKNYSGYDTLPPQDDSGHEKGDAYTSPIKGKIAQQQHPLQKHIDSPNQFGYFLEIETKDSPLQNKKLNLKQIKYWHGQGADSTMDQTKIKIYIFQLENERENNLRNWKKEEKDNQQEIREQKEEQKKDNQEQQGEKIKQIYKQYINKLIKISQLCKSDVIENNNEKGEGNPKNNNQKGEDNINISQQDRFFKFFNSPSSPQSLVMLWPIYQMPFNIIRQSGETQFIYLSTQNQSEDNLMNQIYERAKKQLQSITKKSIKVCKSLSQIIQAEEENKNKNCKSDEKLVVFTSSNQVKLEQLSQSQSKFYIFDHNKKKLTNPHSNNIQYVSSQQQMIEKLKEHKQVKELPNFLYVSPEDIGTSNRLVKVFHTMLNQKIDQGTRHKILDELGKLLLLIGSQSVFYYNYEQSIKEFVNDLKNNERVIYWYTAETSVYKVLNNLLRSTRHPAEIYYLQPFFKGLYNKVKDMFRQKMEKQGKQNFTCYRGTWLTQAEIQKLKNSKGEIIMNLGFMSTTLQKGLGAGMGNCYLEIQVNQENIDEKLCQGYANIEKESFHQFQREVLFNPLNSFLILGFQQDPKTKRVTFKLSYGVLSELETTADKHLYRTEYGKVWMAKEDLFIKDANAKAKIMKDVAKSQRQQVSKLQTQGETLIQGDVNLDGSQNYWRKYEEILEAFNKKQHKYQVQQLNMWAVEIKHYIQLKKRLIFNKEKYQKYVRILLEQIKMLKQLNMDKQVQYASVLVNLGNVYHRKGEDESAIKVYQQAKQIRRVKLGTNHNDYAQVLVNLGNAYQIKGQYENAIKNYQQAKQIYRVKLGTNHNDYATLLINLGNVYQTKGEYESAIKVYEQAKQIIRVKLGTNHNNYAAVLGNLGNVYQIKGEYKKSFSLYQSSMQILSSSLGQSSFQYITTVLNLCDLLFSLNQFDKCLNKLLHCQSKLVLLFKSQPIRRVQQLLIRTTKLLSDVYEKKNMRKESEICMRQCIKLKMQLMGFSQNQIQTMVENIMTHGEKIQYKSRQLNAQIFDICLQFLIVHGQLGLSHIQLIAHLPQQVQSTRKLVDEEMAQACRYIISDLLVRSNLVEAEQTIKFVQFLGFNLPDQVLKLNLLKIKHQKKFQSELISRNQVLCSWQTEEKRQMERQLIRIMGKNSRLYVLMKWLQINELRMMGRYEQAELILEDALKAIDEDQISVEMLQVLWDQL